MMIGTDMGITKPIFIIGSPRSGTSVLYSILAQHNELCWFSKSTLKKFVSKEYLDFIHLRRRIFDIRKLSYPLDDFGPRYFTTIEPPIELGYLWDEVFSGFWDCKIIEENISKILEIIKMTIDKHQNRRFIAKFPTLSIQIPHVLKIFPDAKFIHIVRDGRAVIQSMLKRAEENSNGFFGIPPKNKISEGKNKIQNHTAQWVDILNEIENSSKLLQNDQYFEIRFEDLVTKTEEHLQKLTEFCELNPFLYVYSKNGQTYNIEEKNKQSWEVLTIKKLDDPNEKYEKNNEIEKIILPTLKKYNYIN